MKKKAGFWLFDILTQGSLPNTFFSEYLSRQNMNSSVLNCDTVGNRHTVGTFQIINKHTVQKSAYRGTKFAKKNKHTDLNSTKRAVIE